MNERFPSAYILSIIGLLFGTNHKILFYLLSIFEKKNKINKDRNKIFSSLHIDCCVVTFYFELAIKYSIQGEQTDFFFVITPVVVVVVVAHFQIINLWYTTKKCCYC